jgi:hypothetical protein
MIIGQILRNIQNNILIQSGHNFIALILQGQKTGRLYIKYLILTGGVILPLHQFLRVLQQTIRNIYGLAERRPYKVSHPSRL